MIKTLRDDVTDFRLRNGLNTDEDRCAIWMAQLGSYVMPLPNFRWRREIINRHDAHHVLTGYGPTVSGELSLAAWELGARCFDDWRAKGLCWLLMMCGLLSQPSLTLAAFRKGVSQAAAYSSLKDTNFFNMPLQTLRAILTA